MTGTAIEVPMTGAAVENGAYGDQTRRIVTAAKTAATLTVTGTSDASTIGV